MTTAKLFKNGRSQAVRLPKEFRFEGEAVNIRREGNAVILEPVAMPDGDPWAWLDDMPGEDLDPTFVAAIDELREIDRDFPIDRSVIDAFK